MGNTVTDKSAPATALSVEKTREIREANIGTRLDPLITRINGMIERAAKAEPNRPIQVNTLGDNWLDKCDAVALKEIYEAMGWTVRINETCGKSMSSGEILCSLIFIEPQTESVVSGKTTVTPAAPQLPREK